jgi:hypothetical protein
MNSVVIPGAAGSSLITHELFKYAVVDDATDFPTCLQILALKEDPLPSVLITTATP